MDKEQGSIKFKCFAAGGGLLLEAGAGEGEAQLAASRKLVALQPAHNEEALLQGGELGQAHPLLFVVLTPLHLDQLTADAGAELPDLVLHLGVDHGEVQHLGGGVRVWGTAGALALVLVLLLLIGGLAEDEGLVVGVEDLEGGFGVVDLVLGLDRADESLELDEGAAFLLDEDDPDYPAEVGEYVVQAVMVVVLRQRPGEQHLRGAVLLQELLRVRVHYCLRLLAVDLGRLRPGLELLALQGDLPELLVDVHEVVEGTVLPRFDRRLGL